MKLFLIWYQILNVNRTSAEELMFQKLVQGFEIFSITSSVQTGGSGIDILSAEAQKIFNPTSSVWSVNNSTDRSIYQAEITLLIPPGDQQQQHQHQQQQQQHANNNNNNSITTSMQSQFHFSSSQPNQQTNNGPNLTAESLRKLLEYMQENCLAIEWYGDKIGQSQRSYQFLFNEFKRFYLAAMFPSAFFRTNVTSTNHQMSQSMQSLQSINQQQQQQAALDVYSNIDIISLINEPSSLIFDRPITSNIDERKQTQIHCKAEIIKWLISTLFIDSSTPSSSYKSSITSISSTLSSGASTASIGSHQDHSNFTAYTNDITSQTYRTNSINLDDISTPDFDSQNDTNASLASISTTTLTNAMPSSISSASSNGARQYITIKHLIQNVILSSTSNVNLVHEILRNTYFLNFDDCSTVQDVLTAYRKWFLKETQVPYFMQEPEVFNNYRANSINSFHENDKKSPNNDSNSPTRRLSFISSSSATSTTKISNNPSMSQSLMTIRDNTDNTASYYCDIRIGHMKCLQIFFYHSSNLLLNRNNLTRDKIKNVCAFLLDIYKQFIKRITMDFETWTMVIMTLLKVADFLFNSEYLINNNRNDPDGNYLIKLMTDTLLTAIVKASLSFNINLNLWDQLLKLLAGVNSNSQVVDMWCDIINDLMREVFRVSYKVDIYNLPTAETDQKRKIRKKNLVNIGTSNSVNVVNSSYPPSVESAFSNSITVNQQQQQQQRTSIASLTSKSKLKHSETHSTSLNTTSNNTNNTSGCEIKTNLNQTFPSMNDQIPSSTTKPTTPTSPQQIETKLNTSQTVDDNDNSSSVQSTSSADIFKNDLKTSNNIQSSNDKATLTRQRKPVLIFYF
jgi:hypothetical protein